jgi:hypothetical protein
VGLESLPELQQQELKPEALRKCPSFQLSMTNANRKKSRTASLAILNGPFFLANSRRKWSLNLDDDVDLGGLHCFVDVHPLELLLQRPPNFQLIALDYDHDDGDEK